MSSSNDRLPSGSVLFPLKELRSIETVVDVLSEKEVNIHVENSLTCLRIGS